MGTVMAGVEMIAVVKKTEKSILTTSPGLKKN